MKEMLGKEMKKLLIAIPKLMAGYVILTIIALPIVLLISYLFPALWNGGEIKPIFILVCLAVTAGVFFSLKFVVEKKFKKDKKNLELQ